MKYGVQSVKSTILANPLLTYRESLREIRKYTFFQNNKNYLDYESLCSIMPKARVRKYFPIPCYEIEHEVLGTIARGYDTQKVLNLINEHGIKLKITKKFLRGTNLNHVINKSFTRKILRIALLQNPDLTNALCREHSLLYKID